MLKLFKFNLCLHDGEGGGADAGVGAGESAEGAQGNSAVAAEQQQEVSEVDTEKEFQDLIRGKYKNEYKNATQALIDKRFAKSKETESLLKEQSGILDLLHQRYGTRSNQALLEALENDDAYLEKRAYDLGMTKEQAQLYDRVQRENAQLKEMQQRAQEERQANEQISKWLGEAEGLKAKYPEFDLETELANDGFAAQLKAGVPLELAYKTAHFDELMSSNTAYTAQQTAKKVTQNIQARGTRPQENGASNKSAFTTAKDISKFTLKDFDEIDKKLARGEKVTFR